MGPTPLPAQLLLGLLLLLGAVTGTPLSLFSSISSKRFITRVIGGGQRGSRPSAADVSVPRNARLPLSNPPSPPPVASPVPSFLIRRGGGSSGSSSSSSSSSSSLHSGSSSWFGTGFLRRSDLIDADGFLIETFDVVDGCEEEIIEEVGKKSRRGKRKHPALHECMRVRQVPGDGSCLFHSLTTSLSLALNGSHHSMEMGPLRWYSNHLRQLAVDVLEQEPQRVLHLQGDECMTTEELLAAVAEHNGIKPEKYCKNMRKPTEWGGGPEIVVLANVLHRPIHVYELCDDSDPPLDDPAADDAADDKTRRDGGAGNAAKGGASSDVAMDVATAYGGYTDTLGARSVRGGAAATTEKETATTAAVAAAAATTAAVAAPETPETKWRLRRIACFGSPKFDRCKGGALHVLSADSRFPDLRVGDQMEQGNHFLALFPASTPTRQMEREAEEARAAKRSSKSSSSDADSGNLRGRKKWHAKDLVLERAHEKDQLAAAAAAAAAVAAGSPGSPAAVAAAAASSSSARGFWPFRRGARPKGNEAGSGPEQEQEQQQQGSILKSFAMWLRFLH